MIQVKQLYEVFSDNAGHNYLIPKAQSSGFFKTLKRIEESFDEHGDEDIYEEGFSDLMDYYNLEILEGERYYVVKLNDVVEN